MLHISLPSSQSGSKKPGKSIELRSLNSRRPDLWVLVTKKNMAVVELNGSHKREQSEIRAEESIISLINQSSVETSSRKKSLVLETAGGAADLWGVKEVTVWIGSRHGGGGRGGVVGMV